MIKYYKFWILILVIVGSLVAMMMPAPYGQNPAYHNFADSRFIAGIPNLMDVLSNLFFLIVGVWGIFIILKKKERMAPYSWWTFFIGVSLVAIGSGYYHWNPSNETLVWDRLPMTIAFMGLFMAMLTEYVDRRIEKFLLVPSVLIGLTSVVYWYYTDDLRFYYWVQLVPMLTIPTTMALFKRKHTHASHLLLALIFYTLAKFAEGLDKQIFNLTGTISGHTIKHILASIAILYIVLMVKKRTEKEIQ